MSNENGVSPLGSQATGAFGIFFHSLIPLEDFNALLGIDDREDVLSRYCLVMAAYSIEQYCKRRLVLKRNFERIDVCGDLVLPLREYPVREVSAVDRALGEGPTLGRVVDRAVLAGSAGLRVM